MQAKFISFAAFLSLLGCSADDVTPKQKNGFVALSAQVDVRVRFKAAITVDNYDVRIVSKTDATFSFNNKVSAIGSTPVELAGGDYTVTVNSPTITLPDFGTPTYGVSQDFTVAAGATTSLNLTCKQTNAGVKVGYSDVFKKHCTDNSLSYSTTIEQAGSNLTYAVAETRAGYFNPGSVNVTVSVGDNDFTSTLNLAAQDLVNLTIDLAPDDPGKVSMTITGVDDTNTRDEKITISLKPNTNLGTLKLEEDFATISTGENISTSGSGTAWSGNANFPSLTSAYRAGGAVKLGGAGNGGSITSKVLDLSANSGSVTVKAKVKGWTTVESELKIKVGDVEKVVPYTAVMANVFEEVTVTFPNAGTATSTVVISSATKRVFVDDVKIYN